MVINNYISSINAMYIRGDKTGYLEPWSRVIVYRRSVRMPSVIPLNIKNNTMTLLKGSKYPVLSPLMYIALIDDM